MPDVLFEEIVEVKERVVFKQEKCQLNKGQNTVIGTTKEEVFFKQSFSTFSAKFVLIRSGHVKAHIGFSRSEAKTDLIN